MAPGGSSLTFPTRCSAMFGHYAARAPRRRTNRTQARASKTSPVATRARYAGAPVAASPDEGVWRGKELGFGAPLAAVHASSVGPLTCCETYVPSVFSP